MFYIKNYFSLTQKHRLKPTEQQPKPARDNPQNEDNYLHRGFRFGLHTNKPEKHGSPINR